MTFCKNILALNMHGNSYGFDLDLYWSHLFLLLRSAKVDHKDAAISAVLSAHLQLQKEGFLSAWTNSFVGPWDPSQGLHNPGK